MKSVASGETFSLRILETARVEPADIVLQFAEVAADSRCPEGVACVWEGNAEVVVRATGSDDASAELRLGTHQNRSASFEGVTIELVSVLPHPKERVALRQADYEVTLRVAGGTGTPHP